MLNSSEHEIYHAHNVKMPSIVGIFLTFLSMINTTLVSLKARKVYFQHFSFMSNLNLVLS